MGPSGTTVLVLIGSIILKLNGEVYGDFKEFEKGEILEYGILDLGTHSHWLPAVQEDSNLPTFRNFLLKLDDLNKFVWFLLNYETLSSGGNVVIPYILSSKDAAEFPEVGLVSSFTLSPTTSDDWKTVHIRTKDARENRLGYFAQARMGPVYLSDNLSYTKLCLIICIRTPTRSNESEVAALHALQDLKIPQGIHVQSDSNVDLVKTIKDRLNIYKTTNQATAAMILHLRWSIKVYNYYNFASHMNALYQKILEGISEYQADIIICMDMSLWDAKYQSFLSKFLYRWGENTKCKVMVDTSFMKYTDSGLESYKSYLFHTFTKPVTFLTGQIENVDFKLLKEICEVPYHGFEEFLIIISDERDLWNVLKYVVEINSMNCGIPLSLQYNYYQPTKPDISKLESTLEFLSDVGRKYPFALKRIIFSLRSLLCYNSFNKSDSGSGVILSMIENMQNSKITIATDDCETEWRLLIPIADFKYVVEMSFQNNNSFMKRSQRNYYANIAQILDELNGVIITNNSRIGWENVLLDSTIKENSFSREENCRLQSSYRTQLLNAATLYGFSVLLNINMFSSFDRHPMPVNNTNEFSFRYYQRCQSVPMFKEEKFNLMVSGVSFYYSLTRYSSTAVNELAQLFEFMSLSFNKLEVIFTGTLIAEKKLFRISRLLEFVQYFMNESYFDHGSNISTKTQFYFNLENQNLSLDDANELSKASGNVLTGAHINLISAFDDDLKWKQKTLHLLQQSVEQVGIIVKYNDAIYLFQTVCQEILISSCNYVIIHVDIPEVISSQYTVSPEQVIQAYADNTLNAAVFFEIFLNLREWRRALNQLYPELKVYARIGWPTTNSNRSISTYFNVWRFVNDFSTQYEFPIFAYKAFDDDNDMNFCYGWWKLKKFFINVADPNSYEEKLADFLKIETRRKSRPTQSRSVNKTPSSPNITGIPIELPREENFPWTITNIFIGSMSIAVAVIFMVTFVACIRIRSLKRQFILTEQEKHEFEMGTLSSETNVDGENHIYGMGYDKEQYEVCREDFDQESSIVIGKGQFGVVYKYFMPRFSNIVAVKLPKATEKTQLISILREIKLMAYLGEHQNIVKLLGAYTGEIRTGFVFVITEYLENGSLLEFLRNRSKNHEQDASELLSQLYGFCEDISTGMGYLEAKNVIHGDLAARNVLLDESNVCKISDFGLSKQLYAESIYIQATSKPLPWAWLAVESLDRREFTTKSDVWSMGVTFWEIFTLGNQPYAGLRWDIDFTRKLKDGLRLPKPELIIDEIYEEILKCWNIDPESRPLPGFFASFFGRQKEKAFYMEI